MKTNEKKSKSTKVKKNDKKKTDYILEVKNIGKTFGDFEALSDVSFSIKRGERIGLIGANGAGKTTISEIIAGLTTKSRGEIKYGFEYERIPQEKIGMQFQSSTYPSGLTVKDMISFAVRLRKLYVNNEKLNEWLESFQMQDFYNRKAKSLSGGQRQKLNILMSIIHKPELIILDELSTGLDIAAREDIIEFTNKLLTDNGMSAILISHHMAEIKALCDKVVILGNGKVIDIAKIKDIEKKHGSLEVYSKKLIKDALEQDAILLEESKKYLKSKQIDFEGWELKQIVEKTRKMKKRDNELFEAREWIDKTQNILLKDPSDRALIRRWRRHQKNQKGAE